MAEQLNGSSEIRWFFAEPVSDKITKWFLHGLPKPASSEFQNGRYKEDLRVNDYLLLSGSESVGVKLRGQTKLEIKALVSASRRAEFRDVKGFSDQWIKWTCESEALKSIFQITDTNPDWLSVKKRRYLRRFSADADRLTEIAPSAKPLPISGFSVELTILDLARAWNGFSLGFESFGPKLNSFDGLRAAVVFFFKNQPRNAPMAFAYANSRNFPSWILSLTQPDGNESCRRKRCMR